MQFVDEEDNLTLGALNLLDCGLEALFEFTPETRASDHGPQIQADDALAHQDIGHVILRDLLGQSFNDGRLANTCLADEHRVVLGAPGEDLHDPLDLPLPADDRIQLALPGHLGQVAPELVQHGGAGGGALSRRSRRSLLLALHPGEQLDDGLTHFGEVRAQLLQHLGGHALALADQPEEDVLGADVVVVEKARLLLGEHDDPAGPVSESLEHVWCL